jgi:hypothetical protein
MGGCWTTEEVCSLVKFSTLESVKASPPYNCGSQISKIEIRLSEREALSTQIAAVKTRKDRALVT